MQWCNKIRVRPNKLFFARQFETTSKQKCSNVKPLLSIIFPQGFRISKNIGHLTSGSGGKKTVKRYLKSEQTHKHTNRQTDISTYRKHRPRGPMLWKSRIRETKHLLTDVDSSTDTTVGWTKNTRKPKFFEKVKNSQNAKTQNCLEICQY